MPLVLVLFALAAVIRQGIADTEVHLMYRVPASGILFTQLSPNEGMAPVRKFLLVSENGERRPITGYWASGGHDTPENRAHPDVEIFAPIRGYLQSAEHRPCPVEYEQYFVGTRAQLLERSDDHRHRVYKYLHDTFKCP